MSFFSGTVRKGLYFWVTLAWAPGSARTIRSQPQMTKQPLYCAAQTTLWDMLSHSIPLTNRLSWETSNKAHISHLLKQICTEHPYSLTKCLQLIICWFVLRREKLPWDALIGLMLSGSRFVMLCSIPILQLLLSFILLFCQHFCFHSVTTSQLVETCGNLKLICQVPS